MGGGIIAVEEGLNRGYSGSARANDGYRCGTAATTAFTATAAGGGGR